MQGLLGLARMIDTINGWIGRTFAWLLLIAVTVSAVNAVVRKLFSVSSNAWLELQWYLFGAVFMMCAAWTLQLREHIKIDIVYTRLSTGLRSWVDLIGHIVFLIPFCVLMIALSWPFFLQSFREGEISGNAGGLIVWPAKFLILAGFVLLLAQGLSETIKRIAIMRGSMVDPFADKAAH